ncbi:MAG: DUF4249 family protein [Prevotella sp.]|nr:DUF4249 family protein [Prevotella sp.]
MTKRNIPQQAATPTRRAPLTMTIHLAMLLLLALTSCEHEIDFTYLEGDAKVVIEGYVTNEGVSVRVGRTTSMTATETQPPISDAEIWIDCDDGTSEQLVYNSQYGAYFSTTGMVGQAGHTYHMRALVDGHTYEASSDMQQPAPIDTVFFRSIKVMEERLFLFSLKAKDPDADERNFFWYKLMRENKDYRWGCRSDRGGDYGWFEYDIACSTEKDLTKEVDDDNEEPLHEGDTLQLMLMTTDYDTYEYIQSLLTSERTTSNPITNIKGGALGVFTTASITRSEPLVFHKDEVPIENKR